MFLERLREHANVSRAAKAAGVNRRTVYRERESSDAFRDAWDDAIEEGLDYLEEEARRRAYEGTLKPVYQQGVEVGEVRQYSDTLTIFLLKGGRPEKYAERSKRELSGPGGGPIETRNTGLASDIREIDRHLDELDAEIAALEAAEGVLKEGQG